VDEERGPKRRGGWPRKGKDPLVGRKVGDVGKKTLRGRRDGGGKSPGTREGWKKEHSRSFNYHKKDGRVFSWGGWERQKTSRQNHGKMESEENPPNRA